MRRKDKEITDSKEIRQIIEDAVYCNVAMCQNNNPYVVPMNFGFQEDCIYLHSVNEGWKIDILKENPQDMDFVNMLRNRVMALMREKAREGATTDSLQQSPDVAAQPSGK